MDIESTGLTIVVPEDMEPLLANAKKDLFCDCTQSEMIRKLVMAGLEALDGRPEKAKLQKNGER